MLPPDNHVHTRWSWDTADASSMQRACARAVELGLPGLAFTEHCDFTNWHADDLIALRRPDGTAVSRPSRVAPRPRVQPLDVEGYSADIARCREEFPQLRILSGIEAGEPHLFPASVAAVLAAGTFERVLGSLHGIEVDGALGPINRRTFVGRDPHELMRRYLTDLLVLVSGSAVFSVLAHCDYPRRYWPEDVAGPYAEADFEEEYRAVFRALASSGRALEINTRSPLASTTLMRWWRQEGGDAVSFGGDAHQPFRVGDRFEVAVDVVEAAGFRPGRDRFDFWRR
ncbi:PHP domain-containing protein [Mycobacterium sp. MYCO198283]|uniref:PHP domain-containing protein n=1 Tax=Mycobacterium sp. MYCO198283 TaxID=2883505 RepID=UPI001E32A4E2|nr:PHP domain-containing protein [Mycobacterium sp. MYCO198283]MCG5434047.1 PHP domain-containing protein [Mycobacterium sp. MYCO198283]